MILYKTFFHMCRLENISFDLEKKQGSTFILGDGLQGGVIGLMTIGNSQQECNKFMHQALSFVEKQAGVSVSRN